MDDPKLQESAAALLGQIGVAAAPALQPIQGGANNQVLRLDAGGRSFLLKVYFRHPRDPRDRLGAEFGFCRFAWDHGLRCVPQPLAQDPAAGIGLYEFMEGRKIAADELDEGAVDAALQFYTGVNRHRETPGATALPTASEACFSLAEHIALVRRRVDRLARVRGDSDINRQAVQFIRSELLPTWSRIDSDLASSAPLLPAAVRDALAPDERRLSPSDFGFHNALRAPDGSFRFFDFEYAGWDDPAKMTCDFFCQVAVPVPEKFLDRFTDAVAGDSGNEKALRVRIRLLLPVYRVKWCCIILNDFLPADADRRRFARPEVDEESRKTQQLNKAAAYLSAIAEEHDK